MSEEKETIYDGEVVEDFAKKKIKELRRIRLKSMIFSSSFTICLILFIIFGATMNAWHPAWIFFLVPFIVPDIFDAITKKNIWELPIVMITVILYLFLIFVCGLPAHPWWCIFFIIPLWSIVKQYVTEYKNLKRFK